MNKYIDLRISGDEDDMHNLFSVFRTILSLQSSGSSREIKIDVDGDGSANLGFEFLNDGDQLKSFDDFDADAIPTFYIGE